MDSIDLQDIFVEAEPGILVWKYDRYKGKNYCSKAASAGAVAGGIDARSGRWVIGFSGRSMHRAQLVWILHNGPIKKGMDVDHIDRNKLNDRIENLRLASRSENCCNKGKRADNKSGYKGVSWNKQHRKWYAQIMLQGKNKFLGLFTDVELAHQAYCNAAKEIHGEFSYTHTKE